MWERLGPPEGSRGGLPQHPSPSPPAETAPAYARIEDYLEKVTDYIRTSAHPTIKVAVLEWGLCRTYDWRAGLHAAGSLILYEELSPALTMSCPALLMRNTTDDPTWTSFIYHDHVSWFPGAACRQPTAAWLLRAYPSGHPGV